MTWILVDERKDQREQYGQLLRNHGVHVTELSPRPTLEFIHRPGTDLTGFILDYALHEGDPGIAYSGATLAAHIGQECPGLPIVILSAFLSDPITKEQLRRTRELIDFRVKKDEVEQHPEIFARQLASLAAGYLAIRHAHQRKDHLEAIGGGVLGLSGEITDAPTLTEVVSYLVEVGGKDVALTARALLHELLKVPGPLLASDHAAVFLGIDPPHDDDETLRNHLEPARYKGVFHDLRWVEERQVRLYWRQFLASLKVPVEGFRPALCFICGQTASTLCEDCGNSIDGRHSIPAQRGEVTYPECRQARVCGNCLRKGSLKPGLTIDPRHAALRIDVVRECRSLLRSSQNKTRR